MLVRNYTDPSGPEYQPVYEDWMLCIKVPRNANRDDINSAITRALIIIGLRHLALIILFVILLIFVGSL